MYAVKNSCGHAGYAKYRFILEACKRAKLKFMDADKTAKLKKEDPERAELTIFELGKQTRLKILSDSLGVGAITDVSQC